MWRRAAWTPRRIALAAGAVVLGLLVLAQLALPPLAERRVRSEIGDSSADVTIRAFPGAKLLLGRANSLRVVTPTVTAQEDAPLGELLDRAKKIGRTDATVGRVSVNGLRLSDVRALVEDGRVRATASLSVRDLSSFVPGGGGLTALPAQEDGLARFDATVGALGISTQVRVVVRAVDGDVEVAPESGLASLVSITVFTDPSLAVDAVRGTVEGDTLRIAFEGTLR